MRDHPIHKRLNYDTQAIISTAESQGWLARQLIDNEAISGEFSDLFFAAQWAAVESCKDKSDRVEMTRWMFIYQVAMLDVFYSRHPELVTALHNEQKGTGKELLRLISELGKNGKGANV